MSRLLTFLFAVAMLLACGPDLPQGMTTPGGTPIWGYPDTVEVMVRAEIDGSDVSNTQMGRPNPVHRKWLQKHSYVHVGVEYDSAATADLTPETQQGETVTAYFLLQYKRVE